MTRLNLVLLLAVIASALFLVRTQYESRRLFAELDRARVDARRLATEHERLQVEKREQATPARIERLAREQLQMRNATPAITQYVTLGTVTRGQVPQTGRAAADAAGALP
jgi:cell division protein FtsL